MSRLNYLLRQDAIKRMNYYGRRGIPFFFLIDFDEENCIVEEPDNLPDDEILFSFPSSGNYGEMPFTMKEHFMWEPHPQTIEEYSRSFDIVYKICMQEIHSLQTLLVQHRLKQILHSRIYLFIRVQSTGS